MENQVQDQTQTSRRYFEASRLSLQSLLARGSRAIVLVSAISLFAACQNLKTRSDVSRDANPKSKSAQTMPTSQTNANSSGKSSANPQQTIDQEQAANPGFQLPPIGTQNSNSASGTPTNTSPSGTSSSGNPVSLSKQLPKVGVILGGGGMKSFAHIGVMREFTRARIPVDAIVGLEWGSLMAAFFAGGGQVNDMEWKSMRIKATDLPESSLLSRKVQAESIQIMNEYLQTAFPASMLLEKSKIPVSCPSYSTSQEKLVWFARGSTRDAVSKCLPYPPYFIENQGYVGTPFVIEEAAQVLRQRGANYIIYVNVLHQGELFPSAKKKEYTAEQVLWQEARRASARSAIPGVNLILNVDTGSGGLMDFEGRRNMIEAGSKSARDATNQLVNQYGF